jgi:hypothetical protein
LFKKNNRVEMDLKCKSAGVIVAYFSKEVDHEHCASKTIVPYLEHLDITPFIKSKDVELLSIEKLSYRNRKWHIDGKPLADNVSFISLSCLNDEKKYTLLSDIIYMTYSKPIP